MNKQLNSNCFTFPHDFVYWYETSATNKVLALRRKLVYNRGQQTGKRICSQTGWNWKCPALVRNSQKHSGAQFVVDICKQLTVIPTIFIKLQPNVTNKQTNLRISSNSISQPAQLLAYHEQISKSSKHCAVCLQSTNQSEYCRFRQSMICMCIWNPRP